MVITVNTECPYNILVERGAIDKIGEIVTAMYKNSTKVLLLSDSNVFPIYGENAAKQLAGKGFAVQPYVIPAGEDSKSMRTVMELYKFLADGGFTRSDLIITVGGGVVGDIGGFVAATYLRGLDHIQVPTTLLAQIDASIGGKTGVDLPCGKNFVGAIYQPKAVITDPAALRTLPKYWFVDGMAEMVKYACVCDPELFADLGSGKALRELDNTICRCILHKKKYVEEDVFDKGPRMLLNFGHTFGHALEKLHDYSGITHGRAVAVGMYMAAAIGEGLGITEKGTAEKLGGLLEALELPVSDIYPIEKIIDATVLDKKSTGKNLNMVLLKDIGEAVLHATDRNYLILRCKIIEQQKLRNGSI